MPTVVSTGKKQKMKTESSYEQNIQYAITFIVSGRSGCGPVSCEGARYPVTWLISSAASDKAQTRRREVCGNGPVPANRSV
jgi:hypothetical protein